MFVARRARRYAALGAERYSIVPKIARLKIGKQDIDVHAERYNSNPNRSWISRPKRQ